MIKGGKVTFTVQGPDTPVPAAFGSEQAGSQPSISSNRNVPAVDNLAAGADIATSISTGSPFRGISLAHSPPRQRKQPDPQIGGAEMNAPKEMESISGSSDRASSNELRETQTNTTLGSLQLQMAIVDEMRQREEDELNKVWGKIKIMKDAIKIQKTVSLTVQDGLDELADVFGAIKFYRRKWKAAEQQIKGMMRPTDTQQLQPITDRGTTTPSGSKKRVASSPADKNEEKRLREVALMDGWEIEESRRAKNLRKKKQNEAERRCLESANPQPVATARGQERPRKRRVRARPDALLIKPAEGQTYAEVLKELRSKVMPDEAEAVVTAIRQTRAGEVLIELGQSTKNKDGFRDLLSSTLGNKGRVVNLETRMTVEIRDLDSYTVKDEVTEAIKRDIPEAEVINVALFPCGREQKIAVLEMSGKAALTLVNKGKIKVGWTVCRVRERAIATRCYKCLGYGHVARNCDGTDRSKLCYKCLGDDHKAKVCKGVSRCVLCEEKGFADEELTHAPGTGKCKVYREALQKAKNRL